MHLLFHAHALSNLHAQNRGLRKKGVGRGVTVVFSDEPVKKVSLALTDQTYKKSYYG